MSLIRLAHQSIQNRVHSGDTAIDATLGNGHDTLFLAKQVYPTGKVYGFDVQQMAINATRERLQQQQLQHGVTLIHANHANMAHYIPVSVHGSIKACMFNLGYLPSGDKTIITQTVSTLRALTVACELLAAEGIITILAYTGHNGGEEETASVAQWAEQLDSQRFTVDIHLSRIAHPTAPRLFVVTKSQEKMP
jgi:hypothetical protein